LVLATVVANHVAQQLTGGLRRFAIRGLHARVVFNGGHVAITAATHPRIRIAVTGIAVTGIAVTGIAITGIAITLIFATVDAVGAIVSVTAIRGVVTIATVRGVVAIATVVVRVIARSPCAVAVARAAAARRQRNEARNQE
jgi:hypothetical protein